MFANAVMLQNFDNTSELRVSVPERLPLAQDYSSWKRFRLEAFLRRAECYDLQRKLNHEVGQPTCVGHSAPGDARGAECSNGHGDAVDSMWTTQWKGKRLPSGEFCLESPTLQSLFNQGIQDNLSEQKKVIFHLERPANTSTQ
jgi:hypothetical protein